MSFKTNTFMKIMSIIILLLVPIILLYTLSNRVSVTVLKEEIESLKMKDLAFLANDLNSNVDSISTLSFLLSEDIHVLKLQHLHLIDLAYERNQERLRLMERLRLLNVTGTWDVEYSIITPISEEIVSTNTLAYYDLEATQSIITLNWKYTDQSGQRFVRHIVKPRSKVAKLEEAGLIIEASFTREAVVKTLDTFKIGGKGDPFLFHKENGLITNKTSSLEMIDQLTGQINPSKHEQVEKQVITLDKKEYLVTSMLVPSLDWYLIDYVPLEEIIQPIVKSSNFFYGSVGLLLITSVLAGYLLYRNVQKPIALLIRGVQRLRLGDYSTRITMNPKNEFSFLFKRFNEMTEEMEQLIKKVYVEELHSKEAKLKQLQSQINPHFLYNSFALIRSLTRLDKKESVMNLSLHLSKYYRYTTRVENTTASLKEELQLVEHYLEIQKLHMQHLSYEINVPEEMMALQIPRLMFQPLVENAVLHGIESSEIDGIIIISGSQNELTNTIAVEDNGVGMTTGQLEQLTTNINSPPTENTGYALWNVLERLILQFGKGASITFQSGEKRERGVIVIVTWPRQHNDSEN